MRSDTQATAGAPLAASVKVEHVDYDASTKIASSRAERNRGEGAYPYYSHRAGVGAIAWK